MEWRLCEVKLPFASVLTSPSSSPSPPIYHEGLMRYAMTTNPQAHQAPGPRRVARHGRSRQSHVSCAPPRAHAKTALLQRCLGLAASAAVCRRCASRARRCASRARRGATHSSRARALKRSRAPVVGPRAASEPHPREPQRGAAAPATPLPRTRPPQRQPRRRRARAAKGSHRARDPRSSRAQRKKRRRGCH